MEIHNWIMEIDNSIMDLHNYGLFMDLHYWIMDLHNWIWISIIQLWISNYGILSHLALHRLVSKAFRPERKGPGAHFTNID